MSERSRGEVFRSVFDAAKSGKPHEVSALIRTDTLPYFKGDFDAVVEGLSQAGNGPSWQGGQPDVWTQIVGIGKRNPTVGTALTGLAIDRGILPPGIDKTTDFAAYNAATPAELKML